MVAVSLLTPLPWKHNVIDIELWWIFYLYCGLFSPQSLNRKDRIHDTVAHFWMWFIPKTHFCAWSHFSICHNTINSLLQSKAKSRHNNVQHPNFRKPLLKTYTQLKCVKKIKLNTAFFGKSEVPNMMECNLISLKWRTLCDSHCFGSHFWRDCSVFRHNSYHGQIDLKQLKKRLCLKITAQMGRVDGETGWGQELNPAAHQTREEHVKTNKRMIRLLYRNPRSSFHK